MVPRMVEVVRDRKSGIHCCCLEGCLRVSVIGEKRCALCTSSGQAPVVEPFPTLSVDTHFYFLFSHPRHIIPLLIPSSSPIIRKKIKERDCSDNVILILEVRG
ncbi:hypothetical protein WUBG_10713 [Wuchereria bancrofti]|uniref:Uncharacterized protein n=1 Tax=Wuchereria bancrofti TaxID=6293 RepID=J9E7S9_WUCBA|nr:hypothetical protein WUBG_10713 [Wuchereria bancrofti]